MSKTTKAKYHVIVVALEEEDQIEFLYDRNKERIGFSTSFSDVEQLIDEAISLASDAYAFVKTVK